ncbi:hypothetical protein J7643_05430 [bacterium]|nr:hypothetical protein [bacterium]
MTTRPNLLGAVLAATTVATIGFSAPAQAVPLIGIGASAGAHIGYLSGDKQGASISGPAFELDGNVDAFGFDVAGNLISRLGSDEMLAEVGLRKELSFIPMISLKPGIFYQGQSLFSPTFDHGAGARVDLGLSPILSPLTFEGSVGVSYPLSYQHAIASYMLGANLSLIPMTSIGVRYRGYRDLAVTSDISVMELGLRVSI